MDLGHKPEFMFSTETALDQLQKIPIGNPKPEPIPTAAFHSSLQWPAKGTLALAWLHSLVRAMASLTEATCGVSGFARTQWLQIVQCRYYL